MISLLGMSLFCLLRGKFSDGDWSAAAFQTDITTGQALISPADQQANFEMMAFPVIPGEVVHDTVSGVVGTGWGMSANLVAGSKEEAAAWELIKFLEGEYVQTYRLETGASFPSNLNVNVNKLIDEKGLEPFVAKRSAFYNSYTTTPVIDGVLHSDVYNEINVVLQEIGLGACTPAQGAARVQKAWETWKANN